MPSASSTFWQSTNISVTVPCLQHRQHSDRAQTSVSLCYAFRIIILMQQKHWMLVLWHLIKLWTAIFPLWNKNGVNNPVCECVCMRGCVCVHMCVCMYVYVCVHACMRVCMRACMCMFHYALDELLYVVMSVSFIFSLCNCLCIAYFCVIKLQSSLSCWNCSVKSVLLRFRYTCP